MELSITYEVALSDLRTRDGKTRLEIARMLGVSKDAIRQMEVNNREIYLRKIDGVWHYMEIRNWRREPKPLGGRGRPVEPRGARPRNEVVA